MQDNSAKPGISAGHRSTNAIPTKEKDMLVLSRNQGQKIRIGDDIVITLLGVRGNQYKVGIEAPKSVSVHREEVWQAIRDGVDRK